MHIDNLARAAELARELQLWMDAEQQAQPAVFKEARLTIANMAHGFVPVAGQPAQSTEVAIRLTPAMLLPFIAEQKARVCSELKLLGVSL